MSAALLDGAIVASFIAAASGSLYLFASVIRDVRGELDHRRIVRARFETMAFQSSIGER